MKLSFLFLACLAMINCSAQKNVPYPASDTVQVTGLVNKPVSYTMTDLLNLPDTDFTSLKIFSHRGELKTTYNNVRAVALNKLLEKSLPSVSKPKEMAGLYFVCRAMDEYTVVYSWNELFNNRKPAVFIITRYDDVDLKTMPERPMLLNLTDSVSGKIGLRGLKTIGIHKAE